MQNWYDTTGNGRSYTVLTRIAQPIALERNQNYKTVVDFFFVFISHIPFVDRVTQFHVNDIGDINQINIPSIKVQQ